MSSRSWTVDAYSSRFIRRVGEGPGVALLVHAAGGTEALATWMNCSRWSTGGAGRPLGGISPLRRRSTMRFQRSASVVTEPAAETWLMLNLPAPPLPPWQVPQYCFRNCCDWSNEYDAGCAARGIARLAASANCRRSIEDEFTARWR